MCGVSPSSGSRICWSLTTLFLTTCGFILLLYGGIAPFRQNFIDLRNENVATDRNVGLFANCDSAANDIANEAAMGNGGIGHGVINSTATATTIPQGFIPRQPNGKVDNHTLGEISGYVRDQCERRKDPYLTLFVMTAILSLLAGWLGSLLLIHWLRSLKYLFPVLAGSSLALLVASVMRMLFAYSRLSKYIDCSDLSKKTIDILTSQLGAICFDGLTANQQKPSINRILSEIIPFWVGLPVLFLTVLGLSIALSWLLKKGIHHQEHAASSSYGAPMSYDPSTRPSAPSLSTGYGTGYRA